MKEIGSEYNLEFESLKETQDNIFNYLTTFNTLYLDSGRSCLRLITSHIKKGTILLPEYICDSVIKSFNGFDIIFYKLNSKLEVDFEDLKSKIRDNTRAILIMNYFGSVQPQKTLSKISNLKQDYNFSIIEDTTHSILSTPMTIGDYCICSLRKWFPIPDGGVLYSKTDTLIKISKNELKRNSNIGKIYAMILKTLYLQNHYKDKDFYREIFIESENDLDTQTEIKKISLISELLLKCITLSDVANKRKDNFKILSDNLAKIGINLLVSISKNDCPFILPVILKNRDNLRKYLITNKIYCPVHWPIEGTLLSDKKSARKLSENILSLPIDQRYDEKDMKYFFETIKKYKQENPNEF